MVSPDVHVHADSWCSPLTVHDGQGGDDVDQGGCQPPVQCPPPVGVLLFHTHPTHHLTWAGGQHVYLGDTHLVKHLSLPSKSKQLFHRLQRAGVPTLLKILSKPELSTITFMICFIVFKETEPIFQCQTRLPVVQEALVLELDKKKTKEQK